MTLIFTKILESVELSESFTPKNKEVWDKYIKEVIELTDSKITFIPTLTPRELNSMRNQSYAAGLKEVLEDNFGKLISWKFAETPAVAEFDKEL